MRILEKVGQDMTKKEAIQELYKVFDMAYVDYIVASIEKEEPIFDRDCEHCSKTYGSLGCCDTVSNKWVYSCEEGQREYLLNQIKAEIAMYEADCRLVCDEEPCKQCTDNVFGSIYRIIDKYKVGGEE